MDYPLTVEITRDEFLVLQAVPDVVDVLKRIIRVYERDNVPERQEQRPAGIGVNCLLMPTLINEARIALLRLQGEWKS